MLRSEKVRPSLIIEVTSPKTRGQRSQDQSQAVRHGASAALRDRGCRRGEQPTTAHALSRTVCKVNQFVKVPLDDHGRAWLEPVGLWLGVKVNPKTGGDRLVLIDPSTNRRDFRDYTAIRRKLVAAARHEAQPPCRGTRPKPRPRLAAEAEQRARSKPRRRKPKNEPRCGRAAPPIRSRD